MGNGFVSSAVEVEYLVHGLFIVEGGEPERYVATLVGYMEVRKELQIVLDGRYGHVERVDFPGLHLKGQGVDNPLSLYFLAVLGVNSSGLVTDREAYLT